MNRISKNEKGFSVVEAAMVLAIVVLVGVVGFIVYNNNHKTNVSSNGTVKSSNATKEFQFKELGVQFIPPTSLKNLSYAVQKLPDGQGGLADVLCLDDSQLNALLNECSAAEGQPSTTDAPNFASISRTAGQYNAAQEMGESQLLKQFGTFHIMVGYPNGAICGSSNQTLDNSWSTALHNDQADFVNAFKATAQKINE